MADIDRILLEMERRGHDYFDDTMRIGRVMDLLNRSRVQQGFEQQVVADAPQQIERKIGELVDWLVDMDLRQWQRVTEHLAERRRQYRDRIVGDDAGRFHYDRARLIDSVGGDAQRVVDSYDRRREAQALADGARNAVAAAAAVSAGARRPRRARRRDRDDGRGRRRPGSSWRRSSPRSGSSSFRRSARGRRRRCGARLRALRDSALVVAARAVRAGDREERRIGSARASRPTAGSCAPKARICRPCRASSERRPQRSRRCGPGLRRLRSLLQRRLPQIDRPPVDVDRLQRRILIAHVEALGDDPRARLQLLVQLRNQLLIQRRQQVRASLPSPG